MKQRAYKKLPGRGREGEGFFNVGWGISYLYITEDHLLKVIRIFYKEMYRRYYFADIEAIVLQKRPFLWYLNLSISSIFLLFLLYGMQEGDVILKEMMRWFMIIPLIFFARELYLGMYYRVAIVTPAGQVLIPSLKRSRYVKKVMAMVLPRIEANQSKDQHRNGTVLSESM